MTHTLRDGQPKDIASFKRQILHRSRLLGEQSLEILLTDFIKLSTESLTYANLQEFEKVIFSIENAELKRYLVDCEPLLPEHDQPIMKTLQEFARGRGNNLHVTEANMPKPGHSAI